MTAGFSADPGGETTAPSSVHDSLIWRQSTFSGGTNCVEVALTAEELVYIRDSHSVGNGPVLAISLSSWRYLLNRIRTGELDI